MKAAGLAAFLVFATWPAGAAEIVIEAGRLTPPVLTVTAHERVTFVNRTGRMAHVDFLVPAEGRYMSEVPGQIQATFHQPGRHPYVVHFENAQLTGVVDVREWREPAGEVPLCGGITVEETCIER